MTLEPREYRTSAATIIVAGNLVEIHYDHGIVFTNEKVREVHALRRSVLGDTPHATLTILPEEMDYRSETMQQDQGAMDRGTGALLASAIVTKDSMVEMLTKLYFSYFPQLHRIRVTASEQDARSWLATQMEEIARTGS
ncbi:MAG: hypothetical protein R2815_13565 [Flavobacteriales bacterium]